MSDWRNPIKPLDTVNAVFDLFTIANPNKNRKFKKLRQFKPEKQTNGIDIHEIHIAYDQNAKKKLQRATSCQKGKIEQNVMEKIIQNIDNPFQCGGAYCPARVVNMTPFNSKPESICVKGSNTEQLRANNEDIINDLLIDDFEIQMDSVIKLSKSDDNIVCKSVIQELALSYKQKQLEISNINQDDSGKKLDGYFDQFNMNELKLDGLNGIHMKQEVQININEFHQDQKVQSYETENQQQSKRILLLDQLLAREIQDISENESDQFKKSIKIDKEELSENIELLASFRSINNIILDTKSQQSCDLESSGFKTNNQPLGRPVGSKPKQNFRSRQQFNKIISQPEVQLLTTERPIVLKLCSNSNIYSTFHKAALIFQSKKNQILIVETTKNISEQSECDVYWQQKTEVQIGNLSNKFINHFPCINKIVHKDSFYQSLRGLALKNAMFKSLIIDTFVLPHQLKQLFQMNYSQDSIYIVKPTQLSRGRGIYLTRNPMDFSNDIQSIIQIYMQQPLLHLGRKIDFRIYVLLYNSYAYLYEEALVRSSPKQFNLNSLDIDIHLTNTSIHGPNYKMQLSKFLSQSKQPQKIKHAFKLVAKAVRRLANPLFVKNSFELLGVDVILDVNFSPKIIEINASPSLVTECSADTVKSEMISDILSILQAQDKGRFELIE
ncbi:Tubulin tyrosine ligase [Spironucleus salmonicida]|uniref:Tubulin--tyrosine ligase-like protein 5 n=1 Tax=Spironucleus salmonicida TaxID=348837 RepID=V6LH02_9EUKA|nr:Tubulin tyrosine ligase [Spironucleus salmonicida]|eukprot:EST43588.1 Tubulin tyrosine ligase [Spironucleus salmonicida]